MKKNIVYIILAICYLGLGIWFLKYYMDSNKKYYIVTLHTVNQNGEKEVNEIKEIGKIEEKSIPSKFLILSSSKPISISREKKESLHIEEIKEINYNKYGSDISRYVITLSEEHELFVEHFGKEAVITKKLIDFENRKMELQTFLNKDQVKELKNERWIEKIEPYNSNKHDKKAWEEENEEDKIDSVDKWDDMGGF